MQDRTPKPVTIHLVRHAESETNRRGEFFSEADTPLTALGAEQAYALGAYLAARRTRVDTVYASSLARAAHTAQIIARTLGMDAEQIVSDARLREIDRGAWAGRSREETITEAVRAEMALLDMDHRAPDGESLHDVAERMRRWLAKAVIDARHDGRDTLLAVTHAVAAKCLLQRILSMDPRMAWRLRVDNTSVTTIVHDPVHGWELVRLNATPHLDTPL